MAELLSSTLSRGVVHEPETPALQFAGVSVAYAPGGNGHTAVNSHQYALEDVTFQVGQGERIAVVGPNGAGKSTLFKLIVGLIKPSQGQIAIFGHKPSGHICIAYVPQRSEVDWSFPATVEDVVMMGRVGQIGLLRWPCKADWQAVHRSLKRVNADHLAKKQIGELSGGQQQRVFIARALAQEARLLLLDEPLAGLDVPNQQAIFDILDSLRPDGVTVLVATHDLDLAADRFDKMMLLNKRIVAFGLPTAVLTTDNLLQAYGGHMRIVSTENDETLALADTCCGGGDA
ncbi:MAG: metal ABC transporter ATP-binding protein [Chloroflexi bacterium]|nr:metal ABC transporter ATP-binding protein [Chloroflexota bacterium]